MPDSTDSRHPRPVKKGEPRSGIAEPRSGIAEPRSGIAEPRSGIAEPRALRRALRQDVRPGELLKRIPASDASVRLAMGLGVGLVIGWVGQFATPLFDVHPGLGIAVALGNAGLALALAAFGRFRQVPREALWGVAGLVLAGALFVIGAEWGYSRTLGGFEGYALPRHRLSYGPEARTVSLTASDRTSLKATYLGRAKGDRPAGKAILILPGWLSTRDSFSTATLALWFHPEYDVLVLDPRGQGASGGAQHPDGSARFDILAGVAFLKAQGNEAVGVLAEREAAYAAVLAAGAPQQVGGEAQGARARLFDSLFLASPVAQWGEPSLGSGFWRDPTHPIGRITWRVAAGVRLKGGTAQPMAEILPRLAGTPVMLSGPQEDPEGILRQLHLLTPEPRSLRLFAGSGQPVPWKAYHRYYETARQFFGMTLAKPTPASAPEELPAELRQAIDSLSPAAGEP